MWELKEELNSLKEEKKKEAVKKVIAAMTVGKDVSQVFTDVLNCMQTDNLELKKLVYLYLMNYAKTKPDLAILAVNTFQRVHILSLFPSFLIDCRMPTSLSLSLLLTSPLTGLRRSQSVNSCLSDSNDELYSCRQNYRVFVRAIATLS
jgi:hypothetical protein